MTLVTLIFLVTRVVHKVTLSRLAQRLISHDTEANPLERPLLVVVTQLCSLLIILLASAKDYANPKVSI